MVSVRSVDLDLVETAIRAVVPDVGLVRASARLEQDLGIDEVSRILVLATLEELTGVHLPEDLIDVLSSVDDLIYFFNVRVTAEIQ